MDGERPDPFCPASIQIAHKAAAKFLQRVRPALSGLFRDDLRHEAEVGVWIAARCFRGDGGKGWHNYAYGGALKRMRDFLRMVDPQARVRRTNYQRERRGDPARVPLPTVDTFGQYEGLDVADRRPAAPDVLDLLEWLAVRIGRLPSRDARVAALCLRDGMTQREVARIIGRSEQRVSQIMAEVRETLAREYAGVA